MSAALSRRTALRGSLAASLGLAAGVASAAVEGNFPSTGSRVSAEVPTLSANDRRLVELADAYEALDRRCDAHAAAHRHNHTPATDDEFALLAAGFQPIEDEVAVTPANSLVGVLAKVRLCRSPTARGCAENEHAFSIADDLCRLQAGGGLAHV